MEHTSIIAGKLPFWASLQNKRTKTKRPKTKIPKKDPTLTNKNTFLHVGKQPPIFGKFLFSFKLHSFISASCVLLKIL